MSDLKVKTDMVHAFARLKLETYTDILRIKKPHSSAHTAGQMLCRLISIFRGIKDSSELEFSDWRQIQEYIHYKPNVMKFNIEITDIIQHMILG